MEKKSVSVFRDKIQVKQADLKSLATLIIKDEQVMAAALENLTAKNETIRYNSYRAIKTITETSFNGYLLFQFASDFDAIK